MRGPSGTATVRRVTSPGATTEREKENSDPVKRSLRSTRSTASVSSTINTKSAPTSKPRSRGKLADIAWDDPPELGVAAVAPRETASEPTKALVLSPLRRPTVKPPKIPSSEHPAKAGAEPEVDVFVRSPGVAAADAAVGDEHQQGSRMITISQARELVQSAFFVSGMATTKMLVDEEKERTREVEEELKRVRGELEALVEVHQATTTELDGAMADLAVVRDGYEKVSSDLRDALSREARLLGAQKDLEQEYDDMLAILEQLRGDDLSQDGTDDDESADLRAQMNQHTSSTYGYPHTGGYNGDTPTIAEESSLMEDPAEETDGQTTNGEDSIMGMLNDSQDWPKVPTAAIPVEDTLISPEDSLCDSDLVLVDLPLGLSPAQQAQMVNERRKKGLTKLRKMASTRSAKTAAAASVSNATIGAKAGTFRSFLLKSSASKRSEDSTVHSVSTVASNATSSSTETQREDTADVKEQTEKKEKRLTKTLSTGTLTTMINSLKLSTSAPSAATEPVDGIKLVPDSHA